MRSLGSWLQQAPNGASPAMHAASAQWPFSVEFLMHPSQTGSASVHMVMENWGLRILVDSTIRYRGNTTPPPAECRVFASGPRPREVEGWETITSIIWTKNYLCLQVLHYSGQARQQSQSLCAIGFGAVCGSLLKVVCVLVCLYSYAIQAAFDPGEPGSPGS